ncbi:hypothetical protein PENTCL1PPCAC_28922, partial [Pristionchus entomophagus]
LKFTTIVASTQIRIQMKERYEKILAMRSLVPLRTPVSHREGVMIVLFLTVVPLSSTPPPPFTVVVEAV